MKRGLKCSLDETVFDELSRGSLFCCDTRDEEAWAIFITVLINRTREKRSYF